MIISTLGLVPSEMEPTYLQILENVITPFEEWGRYYYVPSSELNSIKLGELCDKYIGEHTIDHLKDMEDCYGDAFLVNQKNELLFNCYFEMLQSPDNLYFLFSFMNFNKNTYIKKEILCVKNDVLILHHDQSLEMKDYDLVSVDMTALNLRKPISVK